MHSAQSWLVSMFPGQYSVLQWLCEENDYVARTTYRFIHLLEQIERITNGEEAPGEDTLEELKLQGLLLKDELNRQLKQVGQVQAYSRVAVNEPVA